MGSLKNSSTRLVAENPDGPGNIASPTHYTTHLRFELGDVSKIDEDRTDKVSGMSSVVHQGNNRYQVICGGDVESMYTAAKHLPEMKSAGIVATKPDVNVREEARSKAYDEYT